MRSIGLYLKSWPKYPHLVSKEPLRHRIAIAKALYLYCSTVQQVEHSSQQCTMAIVLHIKTTVFNCVVCV